MLKSGNALPQQCAYNLVRTMVGEVPMERAKGLKAEYIDAPVSSASGLRADVDFLLSHYEPRIDVKNVSLRELGIPMGDFGLAVNVTDGDGRNGG